MEKKHHLILKRLLRFNLLFRNIQNSQYSFTMDISRVNEPTVDVLV